MTTSLDTTSLHTTSLPENSAGGRLVSVDGRALPLRSATLTGRAAAGQACVTLTQVFSNTWAQPLQVTYQLPLPADAAVGGFAFELGDRRVEGRVQTREQARADFDAALAAGRTAALLEQDRSSVFEQTIGNIPAGASVTVHVTVDQPLTWLSEGAWEWRFPTVVAPRYQGEPGRVSDAARTTTHVADAPIAPRAALELQIADATTGAPHSPSHALFVDHRSDADTAVGLADTGPVGAALDRDVVVRWPVAAPQPGTTLTCARPSRGARGADLAYGLLTVVPPESGANTRAVGRDLIVLIDTSGSQSGEPMEQTKRVTAALIDSLADDDRLEMIEFSSRARRWSRWPKAMSERARRSAHSWVQALQAGGATEMRHAIDKALSGLRGDSQRQVVVITDGLIGFEHEIVASIRHNLPASSRVHMVGVGHGVNRSLTGPAARAGGGIEAICAPGEDPEPVVERLLARMARPLVVDFALSGSALRGQAPVRLPDLFAGAPASIAVALDPSGGDLTLSGRTCDGPWAHVIRVAPVAHDDGDASLARRWARERVEDLELERAMGREGQAIDARIEALGLDFQIATRRTSWVAISDQVDVLPGQPVVAERMPHALASGMSAEGLGLRACLPPQAMSTRTRSGMVAAGALRASRSMAGSPPPAPALELDALALDETLLLDEAPAPMAPAPGGPPRRPLLDLVPEDVSRRLRCVVQKVEDGRVWIAFATQPSVEDLDLLRFLTGLQIEVVVLAEEQLSAELEAFWA